MMHINDIPLRSKFKTVLYADDIICLFHTPVHLLCKVWLIMKYMIGCL